MKAKLQPEISLPPRPRRGLNKETREKPVAPVRWPQRGYGHAQACPGPVGRTSLMAGTGQGRGRGGGGFPARPLGLPFVAESQ